MPALTPVCVNVVPASPAHRYTDAAMANFRDWSTVWFLASARTRAIACLLMFGTVQAGLAIMFLDSAFREPGQLTAGNLRGAAVMGSIGLLSFFTGVFLAASKIIRTSRTVEDRSRRLKG